MKMKYLIRNKTLDKYYSKTIIQNGVYVIIWDDLKHAKLVSFKTAKSIINGKLIYNKENYDLEMEEMK